MNEYLIPNPLINEAEKRRLILLQEKYNKMIEPNAVVKTSKKLYKKVYDVVPDNVKAVGDDVGKMITESDFYKKALEYAGQGFVELEKIAAKMTVSEETAIKSVNKTIRSHDITSMDEICFARATDIAQIVNGYRTSDILIATIEGAGTGFFGFPGIVPNFVASTFLYFRAVQSVAMYYGYDVKNDASEMEIASAVLMSAFDSRADATNNELTAAVGKFMVFAETSTVKQASKKTWAAMIESNGLGLLIAQIRALSNSAARKALQTANKKGLEELAYKNVLEQIGKKATLKNAGKAMPLVGAVFGALFDTAQMKKIIDYADIFYGKRFIEEKEARINAFLNPDEGFNPYVVDVDNVEVS